MDIPAARPVALVVEDDWVRRIDMVQELEQEGWTVLAAEAAEAALDLLLAGYPIDVLVTDVQLGEGPSGWDLAEACRARVSDLPVIYVSADAGDRSRQVPGSWFFDKPCPAALVATACRGFGSRAGAG